MVMDKPLKVSLLISVLAHMLLFLPLELSKANPEQKLDQLNLCYLPPEQPVSQNTRVRLNQPVGPGQQKLHQPDLRLKEKQPARQSADKSEPEAQNKIEIPPEVSPEEQAPYLDYYQSIREKIYEVVLKNYPRYIACGQVRLYFILCSDGRLKEIRLIQEGSTPNRPLQRIALSSVREAAPFIAFPEKLRQKELSFNVAISFELEE